MNIYQHIAAFFLKGSLIRSLLLPIGIIFCSTVLVVGYLWISLSLQQFDKENQRYQQDYISHQKELLRAEVIRAKERMLSESLAIRERLKRDLAATVKTAHDIALGTYNSHFDGGEQHLQRVTLDTLKTLALNQRQANLYVFDQNGHALITPATVTPNKATSDGDSNTDPVQQATSPESPQFIAMLRNAATHKAFFEYPSPDPSNAGQTPRNKIGYAHALHPLGWIITGTYDKAEFDETVKTLALKQLANIKYGINNEGYFFATTYSGDVYVTEWEYFGKSRNVWDLTDSNGQKFAQTGAEIAQANPEGGFLAYVFKMKDGSYSEKISYVLGIDAWQLYIGSGTYLDSINQEVALRTESLSQYMQETVYKILAILAVALIATVITILLISRRYSKNIHVLQSNFAEATSHYVKINPQKINFEEMKALAEGANHMIDSLNQQTDALRYQSLHDYLTGLPNRILGSQHLNHIIEEAIKLNDSASLLFLDLDNFKEINDLNGHTTGDKLLQQVAHRLSLLVDDRGIIARLGGDEFIFISDLGQTRTDSSKLANQILAGLRIPFDLDGSKHYISASIGICQIPEDGNHSEVLLSNADSAMYSAKHAGRNTFQFYSPDMTAEVNRRSEAVQDLRVALQRDEFELHFQPQLDLRTGTMVGAEALIRWAHPSKGLIPPGRFIPYAEASGQIEQIGEWVLRKACSLAAHWYKTGTYTGKVAINISNNQLLNGQLARKVKDVLTETGCPAASIELEITESTVMHHPQQTIAELKELQTLGITIAIDDFGTGYSSLNALKQLPIDKLKIDKAFIDDINVDQNDQEITKAIIAIGSTLNLTIVAEGVEHQPQLDFLAQESCQIIQGYFYSKPLPVDDFLKFAAARAEQTFKDINL